MELLPGTQIIIDTSVIVDIFLVRRPRHSEARRMANMILDAGAKVTAPLHALFEITCAERNEVMQSPSEGNKDITEDRPLSITYVPIDMTFFGRYFDPSISYLKAHDLIYVSMAKGDQALLISEDHKQ